MRVQQVLWFHVLMRTLHVYRTTMTICIVEHNQIYYSYDYCLLGPEELIDLMEYLQKVVGWYNFGIYLDVPRHVLETIRKDYQSNNERKQAMFSWWLDNALEMKKWSAIVHALSNTGYRCLATTVAYNHSECIP